MWRSYVYLFSFRKSFRKTNKNRRPEKKQVEALNVLKTSTQQLTIQDVIPEDRLSEQVKIEIEDKGTEKI